MTTVSLLLGSVASGGINANFLVVAGGGGGGTGVGGTANGGGGGAGGYLSGTFTANTAVTYTVTVGSGGAASTSGSNAVISGTGLTTICLLYTSPSPRD